MNTKAVGQTLQDVVDSVTNSQWAKSIIPSVNELNKTIATNSKLASSLHNETIQKSLATTFQSANIPEEQAVRMAKTVNTGNYSQAIDNLSEDISKYSDKPVDKVVDRAKTVTEKTMREGVDPSKITGFERLKYPVAYFMNPDKSIRNARIATAAATYAGVTVGGRYLSGGTLTTDNYGRKDIAGVPFLQR